MRLIGLCTGALLAAAVAGGAHARDAAAPASTEAVAKSPIVRTTFEYARHGSQKLYLDRIVDNSVAVAGKRPVVIYSFGGGWEAGERNEPLANGFLNHLASLGYVVVAIDYRLAIKEAKAKNEINATNIVDAYLRAIDWGVEDLFDATAYVVRNADAWNVDKDQIVSAGSSAGATNALVAEYHVANWTPLAQKHLPKSFRYAGVISMAGAFWLKGADTALAFKNKPAPIMFFHGPKDQLVTYDETHQGVAAYGPAAFVRKFPGPDYPKWFVDVVDADHIMAAAPLIDYREEVAAFLRKLVRERQAISVHTVETDRTTKTFGNVKTLYGPIFERAQAKPADN